MKISPDAVFTASTAVVCLLTALVQLCEASPVAGQSRNPRSTRRSRQGSSNEYDWLCPTTMCPPVSADCSTVEYMVFEYDVLLGNRIVSVRCQTCEYCLDMPFRARRSLFDVLGSSTRHNRCNSLSCPTTPEGCADQRLTDVFVNGHFCKKCPACFDNTVVATMNSHH